METKKKTVSFSKLISNTYEEESVSLTGLCGFLIVVIPLLIIMFCVGFYFFNVQEANNIITIINCHDCRNWFRSDSRKESQCGFRS